jgi:hypothetical protein
VAVLGRSLTEFPRDSLCETWHSCRSPFLPLPCHGDPPPSTPQGSRFAPSWGKRLVAGHVRVCGNSHGLGIAVPTRQFESSCRYVVWDTLAHSCAPALVFLSLLGTLWGGRDLRGGRCNGLLVLPCLSYPITARVKYYSTVTCLGGNYFLSWPSTVLPSGFPALIPRASKAKLEDGVNQSCNQAIFRLLSFALSSIAPLLLFRVTFGTRRYGYDLFH